MPLYKARFGDQTIPIEADSPEQAALQARLKFAGRIGVDQATAGAVERSPSPAVVKFAEDSAGQNPTQMLAGAEERTAEGLPGYATALGLPFIAAAAAPGLAAGLAKDAAIYGAAEGAERLLGLPSWAGEAVGLLSPARAAKQALGRLLTRGGAEAVTSAAARKVEMTAAEKLAERRLALEAEKLAEKKATREAATAARERSLKLAEERNALLRAKIEGRTPKVAPKVSAPVEPSAAPVAESTASGATVVPATTGIPVPAADTSAIVLKLQQQMGTSSGRKVVRELLEKMPPEQAAQIKALLFRGQEHPATVLGALFDPTKGSLGKVARPGEELARLLGQIQ